jgi:hypothetical protein
VNIPPFLAKWKNHCCSSRYFAHIFNGLFFVYISKTQGVFMKLPVSLLLLVATLLIQCVVDSGDRDYANPMSPSWQEEVNGYLIDDYKIYSWRQAQIQENGDTSWDVFNVEGRYIKTLEVTEHSFALSYHSYASCYTENGYRIYRDASLPYYIDQEDTAAIPHCYEEYKEDSLYSADTVYLNYTEEALSDYIPWLEVPVDSNVWLEALDMVYHQGRCAVVDLLANYRLVDAQGLPDSVLLKSFKVGFSLSTIMLGDGSILPFLGDEKCGKYTLEVIETIIHVTWSLDYFPPAVEVPNGLDVYQNYIAITLPDSSFAEAVRWVMTLEDQYGRRQELEMHSYFSPVVEGESQKLLFSDHSLLSSF